MEPEKEVEMRLSMMALSQAACKFVAWPRKDLRNSRATQKTTLQDDVMVRSDDESRGCQRVM
jgi:hypothetical protein